MNKCTTDKTNNNFLSFILIIVFIVLFDVIAMHCLKYHNDNDNIKYFFISCLIYGTIISFLMLKSLNFSSITAINFSWFCIGTLINIIIGVYIYKEHLNYKKILGIVIAFTGAYIIFSCE
jgi:drug/metabolite transporter (DMT)-like permease